MASTVLASRNETSWGHQSYMGKIPNYSNNKPRHLNPNPNPNPNPNHKPKSNKKKQFPNAGVNNGRHNNINSQPVDPSGLVGQAASDDGYSFNQRPIESNGGDGYGNNFNHGGYISYNIAACSRSEINELRRKLVADLEKIRNLKDRIQAGDLNPRSSHGKFKKVAGNKRQPSSLPFSSSDKESKRCRQGLVNGNGGGEVDENMFKVCRQVLTKLMKHKLSWVFNKPVDAVALGLHDYHQIIKRPIDLGTVKSNLSKNLYPSPLDFSSDVRLVFENAMLYNPRTDEVHGMADQLLTYFEELFRPIQEKLAMAAHHVNEFSAIEELDGSSWDDIQTPERSKKLKSSSPVVPSISNKQNHSSASNPSIPPVARSPVRTPSPIQPPETVKAPLATARVPIVKQPKPRAKDPNKREMNTEEKQKLGLGLQSMPQEKMPQLLQIIRKRNDQLAQEGDEIELDIEALDTETLWELDRFLTNWKKLVSKTKRQALLVNSCSAAVASTSAEEEMDGMKKSKKEAGEEDVDIGEEMPESSFPHVEIERDDGGGLGERRGNGSSSSSSSSSSSGSSSSSSSDSESGSSSGSESDADDAHS